jgi:hypothetical protein
MNSFSRAISITIASSVLCAGCLSLLGSGEEDFTVSLAMQRSWEPPPVLHVTAFGRLVKLTGRSDGVRIEEEVEPRHAGPQEVRVRLVSADGETIASTQHRLVFEPGNSHWIAMVVGRHRPIGHCIGNLTVVPTSLPTDTVFVMHGRIPHGAIC